MPRTVLQECVCRSTVNESLRRFVCCSVLIFVSPLVSLTLRTACMVYRWFLTLEYVGAGETCMVFIQTSLRAGCVDVDWWTSTCHPRSAQVATSTCGWIECFLDYSIMLIVATMFDAMRSINLSPLDCCFGFCFEGTSDSSFCWRYTRARLPLFCKETERHAKHFWIFWWPNSSIFLSSRTTCQCAFEVGEA